jgi:hypothetical protein
MENSMINAIYIGRDIYDRDPYKVLATDSLGQPRADVRGNPYGTDVVTPHVDEATGEVEQGYVARDTTGALVRTFSENRFGVALAASLWDGITGGDFSGDYWRQNMAPKVREVQLLPTDKGDISAQLLAAFKGMGGQM